MNEKIGRNDPCYCGSGVKYKKCCGAKQLTAIVELAKERLQSRLAEGPRPDPNNRQKTIEAMRQNGMDPAYIHAYEQTGVLVFQETMHLIPEEVMARWTEAYESYVPADAWPGGNTHE